VIAKVGNSTTDKNMAGIKEVDQAGQRWLTSGGLRLVFPGTQPVRFFVSCTLLCGIILWWHEADMLNI